MKKILAFALCGALIFSSCSNMNKAGKGTLWGAGGGAIAGAALGYLIGGDLKSAAIGATAGTAVGATTGAVIGQKMDKKAAELAALNAKVETFEINGLEAIRVTFDNGILFKTNETVLSPEAEKSIQSFAAAMADLPVTAFQCVSIREKELTKGACRHRRRIQDYLLKKPCPENRDVTCNIVQKRR